MKWRSTVDRADRESNGSTSSTRGKGRRFAVVPSARSSNQALGRQGETTFFSLSLCIYIFCNVLSNNLISFVPAPLVDY